MDLYFNLTTELPPGAKKHTSTSPISDEIQEEWSGMTAEEKEEITAEALEELDEWKEINGTTRHNSHIAAFHDASKTIAGIEEDVSV